MEKQLNLYFIPLKNNKKARSWVKKKLNKMNSIMRWGVLPNTNFSEGFG